ncbi:hypothetical protein, unlikely [Trypanosoma brucei gambiense DAL972]|uniref:T. brucei spp.-specific protein n=1 Tax=Trypanosoma brucei gambiense (strain MHOM/CI/86/DAL972) TaxID=679716 RepID=C9ZI48_TRYB9|nr:hypothetical protein, unlikely [Trypanosoma brucei gambiense DAL972]CBH09165.1 hypothetical protein, unlikely [Trypanosoma brucei gambiense DAL972]|eukprot:XP_011771606.1 hypothetical protein, unlikely [Trypanosoma brucei gambiense DAL972]
MQKLLSSMLSLLLLLLFVIVASCCNFCLAVVSGFWSSRAYIFSRRFFAHSICLSLRYFFYLFIYFGLRNCVCYFYPFF